MAAVAMNADTKERIDLSGNITEETIVWKVPEGNWKIMQFVCVADDDPNMDYLSEEAAKAYISMTHEAYYKRMPEYFGKTITSTFFDEPTLYRAQARCWTPTFNETYIKKYGSSPALYYPALWYDIGPETQAARNALFGLRAEPKDLSERLVSACRQAGLFTMSRCTDDPNTLAELIRKGVNFIETRRPDITAALLPAGEAEPHGIPLRY